MLTVSASEGQSLLVPFSGSGTECVAAKSMGINYLGIESEGQYVDLSLSRIADVKECFIFEDNKETPK
jgi:DNA modification methylase